VLAAIFVLVTIEGRSFPCCPQWYAEKIKGSPVKAERSKRTDIDRNSRVHTHIGTQRMQDPNGSLRCLLSVSEASAINLKQALSVLCVYQQPVDFLLDFMSFSSTCCWKKFHFHDFFLPMTVGLAALSFAATALGRKADG
jgi:hypothetical protein